MARPWIDRVPEVPMVPYLSRGGSHRRYLWHSILLSTFDTIGTYGIPKDKHLLGRIDSTSLRKQESLISGPHIKYQVVLPPKGVPYRGESQYRS